MKYGYVKSYKYIVIKIKFISSQLFIREYTTYSAYSRYIFFNVSASSKIDVKNFIMLTSLKLIFTGVF